MSVVREFTGHGIGDLRGALHPEFQQARFGPLLKAGITLAIEPMLCLGRAEVVEERRLTAVSADGSLAAHYEHRVALTDEALRHPDPKG